MQNSESEFGSENSQKTYSTPTHPATVLVLEVYKLTMTSPGFPVLTRNQCYRMSCNTSMMGTIRAIVKVTLKRTRCRRFLSTSFFYLGALLIIACCNFSKIYQVSIFLPFLEYQIVIFIVNPSPHIQIQWQFKRNR